MLEVEWGTFFQYCLSFQHQLLPLTTSHKQDQMGMQPLIFWVHFAWTISQHMGLLIRIMMITLCFPKVQLFFSSHPWLPQLPLPLPFKFPTLLASLLSANGVSTALTWNKELTEDIFAGAFTFAFKSTCASSALNSSLSSTKPASSSSRPLDYMLSSSTLSIITSTLLALKHSSSSSPISSWASISAIAWIFLLFSSFSSFSSCSLQAATFTSILLCHGHFWPGAPGLIACFWWVGWDQEVTTFFWLFQWHFKISISTFCLLGSRHGSFQLVFVSYWMAILSLHRNIRLGVTFRCCHLIDWLIKSGSPSRLGPVLLSTLVHGIVLISSYGIYKLPARLDCWPDKLIPPVEHLQNWGVTP